VKEHAFVVKEHAFVVKEHAFVVKEHAFVVKTGTWFVLRLSAKLFSKQPDLVIKA